MKSLLTIFCFCVASVFADSGVWEFSGNGHEIRIDAARTGQIVFWKTGGKTLVDATSPSSPLRLADAEFVVEAAESVSPEELRLRGRLGGSPLTLTYRVKEGGVDIGIEAENAAEFSWSLPLSLEPRKRVYFLGDHGFEWETRYFYQFMVDSPGNLLPDAERNEWRYFGLDLLGKRAFRLWKAESAETSPLIMQEGEQAAPALQIYDQRGGVALEVAGSAPVRLRVDAAGGGVVGAEFREKNFEIALRGFASEEAILAARQPWRKKYAGSPRPSPDEVMCEPAFVRETPMAGGIQYVTGGYPFAAGELHDAGKVRVSVADVAVPVQGRALAYWPDGSVKWALLTFPIDPAKAVEECAAPRISLRRGGYLPVHVTAGEMPEASFFQRLLKRLRNTAGETPEAPARLRVETNSEDHARITDGRFMAEFSTGSRWLRALQWNGKNLLRDDANAQAFTDFRINPETVRPFQRAVGGTADPGVLTVDKLTVEESGPLRAVVRLEGLSGNREPTRVILRIEMLAGRPELRITHTAEFLFKDPRRTFLEAMGMEFPLNQTFTSGRYFNHQASADALLLQSTPRHGELLLGGGEVIPVDGRAEGWIELQSPEFRVIGAIRNFWQQAPKGIGFAEDGLRMELWPREAGLMDVRRYSNYPHRSQGKAVEPKDDWVERKYYPEDPFVGVSRTHEMLLGFWPTDSAPDARSVAADFQSPPLLYAGWERYASTRAVLSAASSEEWPRAWEGWTRLANFWLYHQALYGWHGFWDFGDLRHMMGQGYGWIVPPEKLVEMLREKNRYTKSRDAKNFRASDYQPPNDWAYDNGRWGWSNTEGLPNLFLQHEYLRHGNRAVYFAAEALARHSRDVVTRHDGKWFGAGTRHGVQHWSDGNHEERQTTITEYRPHYFLSGDGRSRDVIEKLYARHYSATPVKVDAAHSGRLGGLLFHWELTGDAAEGEQLRKYVQTFIAPDGIYLEPDVQFPDAVVRGEARRLNDGSMFFHTFGGMHALIEYQQITGDKALSDALIKMADAVVNDPALRERYASGKYGSGRIFWPVIAFAAKHADAPEPYRVFLAGYLTSSGWTYAYQTVTKNPAYWSSIQFNVPMSFFWNNWAPYVLDAAAPREIWTDDIARQFEAAEKSGPREHGIAPGWQSEFDNIPELNDYLGYQQPWNKPTTTNVTSP